MVSHGIVAGSAQATSCATIGSSIASNFAIDLKKLFSVQQRWRSAATQCSTPGAFKRSMAHRSGAAEAPTPGQHRPSGITRAACPNSSKYSPNPKGVLL